MKTVYGLHLDEGRIRSSFPLKLKTELWWPGYGRGEYFETVDDQSNPLSTTRSSLAGRNSNDQNEDRIRSLFGMKTVYGLHF